MERQYKDSGIEWIGKIPETWEVTKLNTLYTQRIEKVSDKDYPPLSVTMQGILPQLENAAKTNNGDDRKLVRVGDFAINSRSDRRGSCGISPYEGSVSLINTILKPRGEMNPRFYNWLFHSSLFSDEFYKWGHGIVDDLWTTRWQEMRNITVPSPTLAVQQRIADYLDEKCGEIDSLIGLQEQMIEKLKAYKQSVITEAVTKGLNPNAKLVSSGIDWIGEIPEGWEVSKLKYYIKVDSGDAITNEHLTESGLYPVYGGGEIMGYYPKYNTEEGSLIIGRVGARCGCVTLPTGKSWASDNALIVKTTWFLKFVYYLLQGANLNRLNTSNAQPLITATKIKNIHVPIIEISEQQAIASYLDGKCSEIDKLIDVKQKKIEKLKDYKKSVIYEAVTGKTDLRDN